MERTVAFTTERASLRGRVDRIDERPARPGVDGETELAIVDYKTGRRPLTMDAARSSMAMAPIRVRACCCRCRPGWAAPSADEHRRRRRHDEDSLARHRKRAAAIADGGGGRVRWRHVGQLAEADKVAPNPTPLCGWCDFARLCPRRGAGRRGVGPAWTRPRSPSRSTD